MAKEKTRRGRKYLWFSLAALVVVIILAVLGGWMYLYDFYLHPERQPVTTTPAEYGLEYEEVELTTEDDLTLSGWLIKPPLPLRADTMPTILAIHGYNSNKGILLPRSAALAKAGYQVFTYDHRACGDSEGDTITMGAMEATDLGGTVLPYVLSLETLDPERLGIYGWSMGGVLAIVGGARVEQFRAVVADSPYASFELISGKALRDNKTPSWPFNWLMWWTLKQQFGLDIRQLDPVRVAGMISPKPLLLLHGTEDTTVPYSHAKMIIEAAKEPKRLVTLPGHDHDDNGSEEIMNDVVIPFFDKYLDVERPLTEKPESESTEENTETEETTNDA